MRNLTEDNITDAVIEKIKADNPRLQQVMEAFVRHLHAFVREVEPTQEEWFMGIDFLTRIGHMCDDKRQEFILMSDTHGVTILVETINHRVEAGMTESTVLGPFYQPGVQLLEMGANIAQGPEQESGEPVVVRGRVVDAVGNPVEGAIIEVWQASPEGFYDVQDPNQPEDNLRGVFKTGADGAYWFRTIKPAAYPIPTDGPVGQLLEATNRHPMRPAHIHFMIKASGFANLITHIFVEGDEYLDSDAVLGVKESLVADFKLNTSEADRAHYGYDKPFYEVNFDFGLKPISA